MSRCKSLGLNAIVNAIKTILSLVFPLITTPYIAKILQVENVGKFNFSYSIISYFYLLGNLGIATYAIREGVKYREDREAFSSFASKIFSINFSSCIFSYIVLFICLVFVPKLYDYRAIILTLSINMIFATLGCEWVFSVYEEYVYLAIRSILSQVLSLFLLFTMVREQDDVLIYSIITVIASSGANIINRVNLKKYCDVRFCIKFEWGHYMIPILLLFSNTLATTIYVNLDTTILGFLVGDYYVGIYSIATKIYTVVKSVLSAIIIVAIPRFSMLWGSGEKVAFEELASKIINVLYVIVVPAVVGLFAMSENIVITISDYTFGRASYSLVILSVGLLFSIFSWFYTSCILIPAKKERYVLMATIVAALVNTTLNFILIPTYFEIAAAFTTLLAEAISLIICCCVAKKNLKKKKMLQGVPSVIVGCLFIVVFCEIVINAFDNIYFEIIVSVIGSFVGYILVLYSFKNETLLQLIVLVKNKLISKKV